MKILIVTDALVTGGAEIFALRLSEALHRFGNDVVIYSLRKNLFDLELKKNYAPNVRIYFPQTSYIWLAQKTDSVFRRLNLHFGLLEYLLSRDLGKFIDRFAPDVIHSHLFTTDTVTRKALKKKNTRWINTVHGDYLQNFRKLRGLNGKGFQRYFSTAKKNLDRLDRVVVISEEQLKFFNSEFSEISLVKFSKIYNGFTAKMMEKNSALISRESLNIPDNAFVFGMVSRPHPDKGWEVAIKAFLKLKIENVFLILVAGGKYMEELKEKYKGETNIFFVGYQPNPVDYIRMFNVGLLPSTYMSESLPTVIIEYLSCEVPVIASDKGEIAIMLRTNEGKMAGKVINLENGEVPVDKFSEAMKSYILDKELFEEHISITCICFEKFEMKKCLAGYNSIYINN